MDGEGKHRQQATSDTALKLLGAAGVQFVLVVAKIKLLILAWQTDLA